MIKIQVECIVEFSMKGELTPKRIRYYENEESIVINVDRILVRDKKTVFATMNVPKSLEFTYKCETVIVGCKKPLSLSFNNYSCKWYLVI